MDDYKVPGSKWFDDNQLTPPETISHGVDEDIRSKLKPWA